jgi:hypothetical protein
MSCSSLGALHAHAGKISANPLDFFFACCVFRHGASAAKAGVPRTGRRVQANSTILSCAVEIGQCVLPMVDLVCENSPTVGATFLGET